ncbi:MAG TPA: hypothetical protein VFW96_22855 [Thermomicrobiales bacterium]|nr:hypothetical protein [Thermomicrobiales bacterium]
MRALRYRVVASSLVDRRRLLTVGDDGEYYLVSLNGVSPQTVPVASGEAKSLEYSRDWVPAHDHTAHTLDDLANQGTYR